MKDLTFAEIDQVAGGAALPLDTLQSQVQSAAANGDYLSASALVKRLYLQHELKRQNDALGQDIANRM